MQTKEILNWLKLFIVSFVFIAAVWAGVQEYARVYAHISFDTPLERIALYSFMLAVVIATAQWVLRPRPKTAEDYARERMAEIGSIVPNPEAVLAPEPSMPEEAFEPSPPAMPSSSRARRSAAKKKPAAKKKGAGKKGRR